VNDKLAQKLLPHYAVFVGSLHADAEPGLSAVWYEVTSHLCSLPYGSQGETVQFLVLHCLRAIREVVAPSSEKRAKKRKRTQWHIDRRVRSMLGVARKCSNSSHGVEFEHFLAFAAILEHFPRCPFKLRSMIFVSVQLPSTTLFGLPFSPPHSSRATSFAAQDHAQARESNAAQSKRSRPLWQFYSGRSARLAARPEGCPAPRHGIPSHAVDQADSRLRSVQEHA
jgi:hypothetical protein